LTTILVTGGAGYIGSHACKALAAAGYAPVAFDNLARGHREAVRWGPFVQGDILDRPALDAALRQYRPAAVMHFAAFAYVGESVSNPGRYYRNNVAGSLTLLEAMRHAGIHQMVFSSSCATYGLPRAPLMAEDHPQEPINPYGASKLMVERMLRDFDAAHGLRAIALRYFNAAGADPAGETGEDHDPEPHLLPQVLDAAAGRMPALTIHGDRHPTPDGTCVRDYVHVSDLAEAHVLALKALQAGCASTAFNLGSGRGSSVREVIDTVQAVTGRPVAVRVGPPRPGDPPMLVADASFARAQLGWQPRIPQLADIVATAWHWHQRRRGGQP
jgi:UDP-arabinose 4-epimerase